MMIGITTTYENPSCSLWYCGQAQTHCTKSM
jgi:hypothetical protein